MEVITTLPHFLAIYYAPDLFYASVVFTSSSLSVAWHMGYSSLGILDHIVAFGWFITDFYYFYNSDFFYVMILCNLSIALLDYLLSYTYLEYTIGHSIWHVLSSIKAIYVAYNLKMDLLSQN